MYLLTEHIQKHVRLSPEEAALFMAHTETLTYKAKSVLQHAGTVCSETYFITSGLVRSFYVNDNIVEHILHFACEGWWISDMYSLFSGKPGDLFIETLEDTDVIVLPKAQQELLYQKLPQLERYFRFLAENSLVSHQERLRDNMSRSAEERFEKFCKRYPALIQRVPQKQIASYIGVTPEFFSKMKGKMVRK
ncbi:Crp/Fnr family transcriptional regulator [Flavobacterium sp.]|uniref:Crp/Fnr family transcriptional regulator n=1 Tax=Flavobacterium sp. TaxID=239 RepID=UPI00262FED72|nr:Crp/Fnr family transcriptional regulator [Flavobacterium sp.]